MYKVYIRAQFNLSRLHTLGKDSKIGGRYEKAKDENWPQFSNGSVDSAELVTMLSQTYFYIYIPFTNRYKSIFFITESFISMLISGLMRMLTTNLYNFIIVCLKTINFFFISAVKAYFRSIRKAIEQSKLEPNPSQTSCPRILSSMVLELPFTQLIYLAVTDVVHYTFTNLF